MREFTKFAIFILALSGSSCVKDSPPRIADITSTIPVKDGLLKTLRIRDGLGGYGSGSEYTLVKIDKKVAYFCPCFEPSKTKPFRVGDKLKIWAWKGNIFATVTAIGRDSVRIFTPERIFIVEPAPSPPEPEVPTATNVPGRPDLIYSPYTGGVTDIAGVPNGTIVLDPTTMKKFRIPSSVR